MKTFRQSIGANEASSYFDYTVYNADDLKAIINAGFDSKGFIIGDILRLLNPKLGTDFDPGTRTIPSNLYMINEIHVDESERGNGLASQALNGFLNLKSDELIVIRTAPLKIDYPEELTENEYDEILMKQAMFLEPFHFRQFNSICNLEHGVPFVYINRNPIAEIIHMETIKREYHRD